MNLFKIACIVMLFKSSLASDHLYGSTSNGDDVSAIPIVTKENNNLKVHSASVYHSKNVVYSYKHNSALDPYENHSENYREVPFFEKRGCFSACYEKNSIALTYDDGPSCHTVALLDVLAREGVKATFFVLGCNLHSYDNQQILKRMYLEGHTIASHTYNHVDMTTLSDLELMQSLHKTSSLIQSIIGRYPIYVRPPYGNYDARVLKIAYSMGFKVIQWNLDLNDWQKTDNPWEMPSELETLLDHFQPVQHHKSWIFLQHDIFASTVNVQQKLISVFRKYGYRFKSLRSCIDIRSGPYRQ